FSPTQFGLDLLLPAFFVARRSPSLKLGDDSVNTPCALAACEANRAATATEAARIEARRSMRFSPLFCLWVLLLSFAFDGRPSRAAFGGRSVATDAAKSRQVILTSGCDSPSRPEVVPPKAGTHTPPPIVGRG